MENNGLIRGHFDKYIFTLLNHDLLAEEEKIDVLEHLDYCSDCMELYLDSIDELCCATPDAALEPTIVSAIAAYKEDQKKKKRKITFFQSAKLAMAVCLTMVMFWGGAISFSRTNGNDLTADTAAPSAEEPLISMDNKFIKRSPGNFFIDMFDSYDRWFNEFVSGVNLPKSKGETKNATKQPPSNKQ